MIPLAFIDEGNPMVDFPQGRESWRDSVKYVCKLHVPMFTSFLDIDGIWLLVVRSLLGGVHSLELLFLPPLKGQFVFAQAATCRFM